MGGDLEESHEINIIGQSYHFKKLIRRDFKKYQRVYMCVLGHTLELFINLDCGIAITGTVRWIFLLSLLKMTNWFLNYITRFIPSPLHSF